MRMKLESILLVFLQNIVIAKALQCVNFILEDKDALHFVGCHFQEPVVLSNQTLGASSMKCSTTIIEIQSQSILRNMARAKGAFFYGKWGLILRFENVPKFLRNELDSLLNVRIFHVPFHDALDKRIESIYSDPFFGDKKEVVKRRIFQGDVFKVGYFPYEPFIHPTMEHVNDGRDSSITFKPDHWQGYEAKLLEVAAEYINFTAVLTKPTTGGLWGLYNVSDNGKYQPGINYDLYNGITDFLLVNPLLDEHKLRHFDLTTYFGVSNYCYLARKPDPYSRWGSVMRPFDLKTWCSILMAFIITEAMAVGLAYLKLEGDVKPRTAFINILKATLNQPYIFKSSLFSRRILSISYGLYAVVITVSYSGLLLTSILITIYPPLWKGTDDLLNFQGRIGAVSLRKRDLFLLSNYTTLADKVRLYDNPVKAFEGVYDGESVYLESRFPTEHLSRKLYQDRHTGEYPFYFLDECFSTYTNVIPLKKNSKLTQPLDDIVIRLVESGIMNKWRKDELLPGLIHSDISQRVNQVTALQFEDILIQFMIWIGGLLLASIVYFIEIYQKDFTKMLGQAIRRKEKQPYYSKRRKRRNCRSFRGPKLHNVVAVK